MTPVFQDDSYYSVVTLHGLFMIFLYLMPILYGVYGNYLMAHNQSASDMVFPRFNIFALQVLGASIIFLLLTTYLSNNIYYGWTLYPPISNTSFIEFMILGLHLSGISSILTSVNLILTTNGQYRTHYDLEDNMPLLPAAYNMGNTLIILALPVLAAAITMLLLDKCNNTAFYLQNNSGDLLLYQHLFWFFGHPEVYILILPCFGIESYLMTYYLEKPPINPPNMLFALYGIGYLSCVVWGHHLYSINMPQEVKDYFSYSTLLIGIPTGVKYFSWLASLGNNELVDDELLNCTYGFLYLFLVGGLTGIMLGNAGLDLVFHDTYYVVGHFHLVMAAAITYSLYAILTLILEIN